MDNLSITSLPEQQHIDYFKWTVCVVESNEEKEKTVNMCFKMDIVISKAVQFGKIHVNAVIDAAALG